MPNSGRVNGVAAASAAHWTREALGYANCLDAGLVSFYEKKPLRAIRYICADAPAAYRHKGKFMKLPNYIVIFVIFALFLMGGVSYAAAPASPQPGKPVQDLPRSTPDRTTVVSVILDGTDSLGARLSTRLKERFNQSSLFKLNSEEEKDSPELRLLLNTAPEFPGRPSVGSVYGVCWVFSQGKGYLGYLLAREIGTVNSDDLDTLVDKLVERTDGIAAKYGNLWK